MIEALQFPKEEMTANLDAAISTLTVTEQEIINNRFLDASELQPRLLIAKRFKVSTTRIMQIEAKALRKLRHPNRIAIINGERSIEQKFEHLSLFGQEMQDARRGRPYDITRFPIAEQLAFKQELARLETQFKARKIWRKKKDRKDREQREREEKRRIAEREETIQQTGKWRPAWGVRMVIDSDNKPKPRDDVELLRMWKDFCKRFPGYWESNLTTIDAMIRRDPQETRVTIGIRCAKAWLNSWQAITCDKEDIL